MVDTITSISKSQRFLLNSLIPYLSLDYFNNNFEFNNYYFVNIYMIILSLSSHEYLNYLIQLFIN